MLRNAQKNKRMNDGEEEGKIVPRIADENPMLMHSSGCRPNGYTVWRAWSNGLKSLAPAFNFFFVPNKTAACTVCPLFALEFFFDLNNSHSTNRCCGSLLDSLCIRQSSLSTPAHPSSAVSAKTNFCKSFRVFGPVSTWNYINNVHKRHVNRRGLQIPWFLFRFIKIYTICYDNMASRWRTDAGRTFSCGHFLHERERKFIIASHQN